MSLTFHPQKRLEEIDYSAPDLVKKAVNTINKKNPLKQSYTFQGFYSNDMELMNNNHHFITDELGFYNQEERLRILGAVPQDMLDQYRHNLEDSLANDRKYITEVDELDQPERYLEMQGYIRNQRNIMEDLDRIGEQRLENKIELLQSLGIQNGSAYDMIDPVKKYFYEKVYGLDYDYTQNEDGSYTLDIQQNGEPFISAELTNNNEIVSVRTPFDDIQNGPSPENNYKQDRKRGKKNSLTM